MTISIQPEDTSSCVPHRWEWLAWLPILLLTVLIAGLWVVDVQTDYEWPSLHMTLNFVTRTLACLVIAFLAGRSFLVGRQPGVLLMGCGVLIWGASGFITTAIVTLDANLGVTISNLGIWAAALCHLTGVSLSLQSRRTIPDTRFGLAVGYALALGFVGLITYATFAGWLPLFFVDGQGGTPVRYVVLGTAFVMLALTAAFLWEMNLQKYSSFNRWYSYALMLIAIGVFGMLLQTSRGSILNWMTRVTQYLSGIYLVIAALSASRTSQIIELPETTEDAWRENEFLAGLRQKPTFGLLMRYGLATVLVTLAFGLRQALGAWVGHGFPPYITFYPAMMAVVLLAGFGPGVLASVLIAFLAAHWILPPLGQASITSPVDRMGLAIFTITNLFMCVFAESYRRNREKAAAYDRESALRESEAKYRSIMDNLQDGFIRANKDGIVIMASPSVAQLCGLESAAEMIGMPVLSLYKNPEDRQILLEKLKIHGRLKDYECEVLRKDGAGVPVSLNIQYHYDENGKIQGTEAFVRDITERKQVETFRSMGQDVLLVLNEDKDQKGAIKRVIDIVKSATGVDAVGIRLQDKDDFPYFYQEGFPEEFLLKENSLLARTRDGGICRDEHGNVCLECTCGLIISSKIDPSSPLFTKGGSAWTNDSFPSLHVPVDDDIRTNPRNECIHQGFASCALIPIRAKGRVVGLLQLNDRRKGRFTLDGIEALEKVAENIGESMLRKQVEDALRATDERLTAVMENLIEGLIIADDQGQAFYWNPAALTMFGYASVNDCRQKLTEFTDTFEVRPLNEARPVPVEDWPMSRVLRGEVLHDWKVRLRRLDQGWEKILAYSGLLISSASGERLTFISISDITNRKQTEQELERMRFMLSEGQRIAHLGSWEYIAATQQTIWSDEQKRIYGLDPTDPSPHYEVMLRNHIHPDDAAELNKSFSKALGSCSIFENENRIVRPDGSIRYIFNRAQPNVDDSGILVGYTGATLDITDRKQADEAVFRNQKIFHELIERSPFGTYVVDSQFNIAIMNTSSQSGAFRNVQPLIGRDFSEVMRILWPEEVAVEIIGHFRHTLETGEPYYSRDFIKPRNDADIIEAYEWELHRMTLPDGQDGVICYYYDSTELREAEAATRESEAKYRNLFENMTEEVHFWEIIRDEEGCIKTWKLIDANPPTLKTWGRMSLDKIKGKTTDEIFGPGATEHYMPVVQKIMTEGVPFVFEDYFPHLDKFFRFTSVPLGDCFITTGSDITAIKKAQDALQLSEQRLRSHIENTPLAVVEWDKDFIVTRWAGEAEKMFGWSAAETVGKPAVDLNMIYEPDIPIVQETMVKLTSGSNQVISTNRNITKDRRVINCTWYNSVQMNSQGKMESVLSLVQDITDRIHAEQSLKKLNEELENKVMQRTAELREKDQILLFQSRQAAMGEMIGNISHQWRQPLNILGMQLQQLPLFYDLGQFNKELLDRNVAGSMQIINHMSKTIDDFRNYFKPDKDKKEFKVHESIKQCLSLLEGSLKNPLIDVEVVANDDVTIYGYPNEFTQVILNIINNARDVFIERNVSKPKIHIKICNEGRCVVVTVADNAGGVPEDIINKVFDPYFTTKGPQQGTGVGLFMSKSIIEKNMGGRLNVRNVADGAEFRIEVLHGIPT